MCKFQKRKICTVHFNLCALSNAKKKERKINLGEISMEGNGIGCRTTSQRARKPISVEDYSRQRRERVIPTGFFPLCVIIFLQVSAGDTRVGAAASIKALASCAAEERVVFTHDFSLLENDPTMLFHMSWVCDMWNSRGGLSEKPTVKKKKHMQKCEMWIYRTEVFLSHFSPTKKSEPPRHLDVHVVGSTFSWLSGDQSLQLALASCLLAPLHDEAARHLRHAASWTWPWIK